MSPTDADAFQRPSVVPPGAVVRVTERTPHCVIGEVDLGDRRVGRIVWDLDGPLSHEQYDDLDGREHGVEREYSMWVGDPDFPPQPPPTVRWLLEWRHGVMHGWSILLDDGAPLTVTPFAEGRGVDFFGDREGIGEHREMRAGQRHGIERWGGTAPWLETWFFDGRPHGITREWQPDTDTLKDGFPRFHIDGEQVTRDAYLAACADDPTLPPYRAEDDEPTRPEHPALTDALARAAEWAPTFDLDTWLAERDAALLALWADAG